MTRSNLLRPSGYLISFAASLQQRSQAAQLQQLVGAITEPVYAETSILLLLLQTVQQGLQQLAAAAAAAAAGDGRQAETAEDGMRSCSTAVKLGDVEFVPVAPGLAVAPDAAAAAAQAAAEACDVLQDAVDDDIIQGTTEDTNMAALISRTTSYAVHCGLSGWASACTGRASMQVTLCIIPG